MANRHAFQLLNNNLTPVLLGSQGESLKRPMLKDWQSANVTVEDVQSWPENNNVGVRCGWQTNGLFLAVFDFDLYADETFPTWLKQARAEIGEPITIIKTGKGYHVPLLVTGAVDTGLIAGEYIDQDGGRRKLNTIIEVRGERQQVVSAGSLHPNGHRYELQSGGYDWMPPITPEQYKKLIFHAAHFDRRELVSEPKRSTVTAATYQPTGELEGIANCLDYARRYIAHDKVKHTTYRDNGQQVTALKFGGNGGLFVWEDGAGWFNHSEGRGGNLVDLIAWHRNISTGEALAMLRPGKQTATIEDDPLPDWAANDPTPNTQKTPIVGVAIDPRELYERHTNGELAGDFFGEERRPVMVMPARKHDAPGGEGQWPKPPKRTNEKAAPIGTVIPVTPGPTNTKFQIVPRWSRAWELDRREYYFRVKREAQKAHWHMAIAPMYYHEFATMDDADRFIAARRKAEYRARKDGQHMTPHVYQLYFYVDGDGWRYTLVSNIADNAPGEIPADRTAAMALFDPWLNTPEDVKLNRHSQGYGGDFQGMSGDGRKKQADDLSKELGIEQSKPKSLHLVTEMMPEDVKELIGKAFKKFELPNEDVPDFLRELKRLIPDLKLRGGGNPETAWRMGCPQLTDTSKASKKVCVSHGQEQTTGGGAPPKPAQKQPVREEITV